MTYVSPTWVFAADTYLLKLQRLQNCFPRHWKFYKAHTGPRDACGFQSSVCLWFYHIIMQAEVIQSHNLNVCNTDQSEVQHRTYKRLKLAVVKFRTVQVTDLPLIRRVNWIKHNLLNKPGLSEAIYVLHILNCKNRLVLFVNSFM
jgi:hypothetical protein